MPKAKHLQRGEIKKTVSLSLSETTLQRLDSLAIALEVSRSELVEMIGRGELPLASQKEKLVGELLSS
ncbi:CopG family transcriptional regulator [Tolypothrix sp. VBCCA 56010]|uniref:ribbon-helix-helix domain-containing protein n=1 Tax=Tolypothrix sp. VBCCA 56010 TaxID=3137731 RepID=UPI003D7E66D3